MPALQLHLDCKLSPAYLTLDLAESLQLLEPCGTDNPAALFGLFHLQLVSVSPLGAEGKHLRLEAGEKGSPSANCAVWGEAGRLPLCAR